VPRITYGIGCEESRLENETEATLSRVQIVAGLILGGNQIYIFTIKTGSMD
jgi:hypothetical protein